MQKPPCFFVQNNWVQRVTIPVALFARQVGVSLEDRSVTSEFDPDNCGVDWSQYGLVLAVGSVQFVRQLKQSKHFQDVIMHDDVSFAASTWRDKLAGALLNEVGWVMPVGEVESLLVSGEAFHIRPNAEDKAFHAKVFELASWNEMRGEREVPADLECWVSPVKQIATEWRCWFIGGKLIEISQYRHDGQMSKLRGAPDDVIAFATHIGRTWLPVDCVVMDIARTSDGLKVIEFNPIHSSGWYAADAPAVLRAWLLRMRSAL